MTARHILQQETGAQRRHPLKDQIQPPAGQTHWDVIVAGGGITGAGILLECARLGLKTLLVEQQDFAWGTSSKSSKMVHGGLRYLAAGHFGLTRDAVRERQRLIREVPGLVDPMQYLMGHYAGQFPSGFIFNRLLDVYDMMAGEHNHRQFPAREAGQLAPGILGDGLRSLTQFGDAVTDDARLVMRVLQEAQRYGGRAVNYCAAAGVLRSGGQIRAARLKDRLTGEEYEIPTRVLINATGAWADRLRAPEGKTGVIRPLRGSHLVLPGWRLPITFSHTFLHPADQRPIFVFPWEGTTVFGTTDLDHKADMDEDAQIVEEEVRYLLDGVNAAYPGWGIRREDLLSSWSGVRPVISSGGGLDPSREKREHSIWNDEGLITVAGGKLTTFRLIALEVLDTLRTMLPDLPASRPQEALFADGAQCRRQVPQLAAVDGLDRGTAARWTGRYGLEAQSLRALAKAQPGFEGADSLQPIPGTTVRWIELEWALRSEAVVHLDDLLLRRTRLGSILPQGAKQIVDAVAARCAVVLGWSPATMQAEIDRYLAIWASDFSIPTHALAGEGL